MLRKTFMTVGWKPTTLSEIANQKEIRVSSERRGGGYRRWTPIWTVRVGDELFVRSGFGANGSWYRHATNSQAYIKAAGTLYKVGLIRLTDPASVAAVDAKKLPVPPQLLRGFLFLEAVTRMTGLATGTPTRERIALPSPVCLRFHGESGHVN